MLTVSRYNVHARSSVRGSTAQQSVHTADEPSKPAEHHVVLAAAASRCVRRPCAEAAENYELSIGDSGVSGLWSVAGARFERVRDPLLVEQCAQRGEPLADLGRSGRGGHI